MIDKIAKIWSGNRTLLVEVRRKSAKILDSQGISVSWGLSGTCISWVDGQKPLNRRPYCGRIDSVAFRCTNYEAKWEIPV